MRISLKLVGCGLALPVSLLTALGAPWDWAEVSGGASREYYNSAARLTWRHHLGDWEDAVGTPQGEAAFATAKAARLDSGGVIEFDITGLAREWISGRRVNKGILLRQVGGDAGPVELVSREHEDAERRPELVIEFGGESRSIRPAADTFLDPSTYRAIGGASPVLRVGIRNHALLRFPAGEIRSSSIERAVVRLTIERVFGAGDPAVIGVFACAQGESAEAIETPPRLGLAAGFPQDAGIDSHPAVIFAATFDDAAWKRRWTSAGPEETLGIVESDDRRAGFEPLAGPALRVVMPEGEHTALNTIYKFLAESGSEPEEIFFRYYLRLGSDWNQTVSGGKMPGISGTYGVAGWGGRKSDGANGWSARGQFFPTIPEGNPLAGLHPLGTYCYHADMQGQYGDAWVWSRGRRGYLESSQWSCVEQYLKLNTPGERDGILRAWIDGRIAFEKSDIRFRLVDRLKIEQIWMNVYHGGRDPSPRDQTLFIDNVVVAREYVGPMASPD